MLNKIKKLFCQTKKHVFFINKILKNSFIIQMSKTHNTLNVFL